MLFSCKENKEGSIKTDESVIDSDSANADILIVHDGKKIEFFEHYFDSIICANIATGIDSLIINCVHSSDDFNNLIYETNFAFFGKLILLENNNSQYLGYVSADDNIWGSHYWLALFGKSIDEVILLDQVFMPNMLDSAQVFNGSDILIYYQSDLTSEMDSSGTHHWSIAEGKIVLMK